jgi:hypothetical protein
MFNPRAPAGMSTAGGVPGGGGSFVKADCSWHLEGSVSPQPHVLFCRPDAVPPLTASQVACMSVKTAGRHSNKSTYSRISYKKSVDER